MESIEVAEEEVMTACEVVVITAAVRWFIHNCPRRYLSTPMRSHITSHLIEQRRLETTIIGHQLRRIHQAIEEVVRHRNIVLLGLPVQRHLGESECEK